MLTNRINRNNDDRRKCRLEFGRKDGQKGTLGSKIHRADMMFTRTGLVPDLVINPNCMPKRMTIGQLIEGLMAKVCAIKGIYGDATPFTGVDLNAYNEELVAAGYDAWGNETTYNGMTGEKMVRQIFITPIYYQRLKQMVGDKAHCLSTDHEVLTIDGWKFNHQLSVADKVATLVDEKLVYQNPIKILNYPNYQGDMYKISTNDVDLMVTPNHRMWVSNDGSKFNFELAEDIHGKRTYKKNALWDASGEFINNIPVQPHKQLPEWVWSLSTINSRSLLESIPYITTCKAYIDDLMRLALHCGWSCNATEMNNTWKLCINKHNPVVDHDVDQVIIKDYNKPVFCLEVPGGVFYVRRNGKPVWTGNSRARGQLQLLTRQPTEGHVIMFI